MLIPLSYVSVPLDLKPLYRVKQLFGGSLTLRDYDGQVAEAMALVRALNKMTKAGMPESVRIA